MQTKGKKPGTRPKKAGRQAAMKKDDADQSKRFIAKAREIEADEKSSTSDQLLGRLAKMKPEPRKSVAKK